MSDLFGSCVAAPPAPQREEKSQTTTYNRGPCIGFLMSHRDQNTWLKTAGGRRALSWLLVSENTVCYDGDGRAEAEDLSVDWCRGLVLCPESTGSESRARSRHNLQGLSPSHHPVSILRSYSIQNFCWRPEPSQYGPVGDISESNLNSLWLKE